MATISSFRDLRVFQAAFAAGMRIYHLSKEWPAEERYELTGQVRRSSRSVCACITEAWRKRRYPAAFAAKLNDAEAEAAETRVWLDVAHACGYLSSAEHRALDREYHSILAQLVHMIDHADEWAVGKPDLSPQGRIQRRQPDRAPESLGGEEGGRAPHPQSPSPRAETKEDPSPEASAARTDPQSRRKAPQRQP